MARSKVNRRDFLKSAAAGAAGASVLTLPAASSARVYAANERVGVGFIGVGGRCQQHLDVILELQKENKGVQPVAVCDVWGGQVTAGVIKGRGLYPSAERCGLKVDDKKHVAKNYQDVLALKE